MTEWKKIPSFPSYSACETGEIKRTEPTKYHPLTNAVLKPRLTNNGYYRLTLRKEGKDFLASVHVLVCEAFHGPRPSLYHQVAHWDGDKANNHESNLRWATPKENAEDRSRHGRDRMGEDHWSFKYPDRVVRGEANKGGGGKLSEDIVRSIRNENLYLKQISIKYGISISLASQIRRREAWKHVD